MRHEVTDADTAAALGSGDVPVLATPRLIAWMEAATVHSAATLLTPHQTTVGTAVRIEHRRASVVGSSVEVAAVAPEGPAGRRLTFRVRATDAFGTLLAVGEMDRVIVDRQRFIQAASAPHDETRKG